MSSIKSSVAAEVPSASVGRRGRVVRRRIVGVASLTLPERARLVEQLHDIYAETLSGMSATELEAEVFGSDQTRLALFYGEDGELAGYSYARIDRLELEGRACAVFGAGVIFRLAYKGGLASSLFGLTEAVRFKLREPRVSLAYLTRASSPAAYRIVASTMPVMAPYPDRATPELALRCVEELSKRRGYQRTGGSPWVVRSPGVPIRPERLKRLEGEPLTRFYLTMNPSFAEGTALVMWARLDAADLLIALARVALRKLGA